MNKADLLNSYIGRAVKYTFKAPAQSNKASFNLGFWNAVIVSKFWNGEIIEPFDINQLSYYYRSFVFDRRSSVYAFGLMTLGKLD